MAEKSDLLTFEDTVGPYYPPSFVLGEAIGRALIDGTVNVPQGTPITLEGCILDENGARVAPVLIEFWHTDAKGRRPGSVDCDPWLASPVRRYSIDGCFRLETIMPGSTLPGRAPHVTVTIFCDGIAKVVTQLFFDGEPANASDPVLGSLPSDLQARLIARATGHEATFHRDITLRGEGETPFFDDLGW